ncbi:MarR family winged helix-turn-helix transcriptional regulator [Mucilaginibacter paludis]|uniref:Regulatory protein MarR n=1 Tax=Mucilaginibacter paludis DSM 18603 TaxID=714943 RepID=H1Y289_9SPHI|nr:MarR family winged helix-turn-helix transcriptional regulator [Mucilaginibacter paludis]EHQ27869.1 regulatory protein MarR [Mucilaginibacter paludis DSM 18603]
MNFGEDLSLQVMLVHKAYHQFLLKSFQDIDVYQHLQIIVFINRIGGSCTQKQICEGLQIEKSYLVKIIDALVQKGYILKRVSHKDRRSNQINLTARATEIADSFTNQMEKFTEAMGEHLTWQERHNCVRALKLVSENFNHIKNQGFD